jgi:tetratricopeptide (TPR) repeat protein
VLPDRCRRHPTNGLFHFYLGWNAFLSGDLEASLEAMRRSVELLPTEAAAHFNLGLALLATGNAAASEKAYQRGVALARREANVRLVFEGVLNDFSLLQKFPDADEEAATRMHAWLQEQWDQLSQQRKDAPIQNNNDA